MPFHNFDMSSYIVQFLNEVNDVQLFESAGIPIEPGYNERLGEVYNRWINTGEYMPHPPLLRRSINKELHDARLADAYTDILNNGLYGWENRMMIFGASDSAEYMLRLDNGKFYRVYAVNFDGTPKVDEIREYISA